MEDRIKECISLNEDKFKEDSIAQQFEESSEEFKKLVEKGFAQERGNNLLSISDNESISKVIFNTNK